jgi:hypothetical protein
MPAKMTTRQLEFYRELLAPFRDDQLSEVPGRGGKTFTFVDKRAIENRLDEVCGPHRWWASYQALDRGLICSLTLMVPDVTEDGFLCVTKEDGAGPEEMSDVDNDIKSTFTNALRRTAQDAWGIGRYLYRKGIPNFLDPNARASQSEAQIELRNQATATPAPSPSPTPSPKAVPASNPIKGLPAGNVTQIALPKPGGGVWAWAKEMEKVFETQVVSGMMAEARQFGPDTTLKGMTQDQLDHVLSGVIKFLKGLPNYKGQFDSYDTRVVTPEPTPEPVKPTSDERSAAATIATTPDANLNLAKRNLMNSMQALMAKQLGRKAELPELKAALAQVSPVVNDGSGHAGQVCESLSSCTDLVWILNMLKLVDDQIKVADSLPEGETIPF